ncbi:unnamed protein product [Victoria cruziana]
MSLRSTALATAVERWKELINQPTSLQLYVTLAMLSVTTLLLLCRFFRRATSNTIVLAGLSGSGKTVIFYQLRDGSSHQGTVTSMDQNEGTFILHSEADKKGKIKPVHIVDVPGHSRLRPKLDEFLPEAAGVIFIIDALDFLPNIQAVAEYLYDILTKACIVKKKTPVMMVCNKADKVTAHSKEFIRKQLERELDKLRASRNAISAADIGNEFMLGEPGKPFAFSECCNKVTVTDASGMTGEISEIEHFIRKHVRT